ncbi:unnamed protein product [Toxocara canis]|uniref:C2 domain-containing protein n=1 Tax=Toxocara canis TaxID=6265 RepID=A0A183U501_TOXCA|nr:unnamed protein product [Toxocara canis]
MSQLLDRFSSENRAINFHDVVREEPIPTIFSAFGTLFGPADTSRKLKPMRRPTIRQQVRLDYRIVVNVQSAINLPERIHGPLQPFVEFSFQGSTTRTTVVSGRNPCWQQSIAIKLSRTREMENDFKLIVDYLQLNIYDEVVTKLDSEPNSVHEQLEKHLIGCVLIPFSTVYCNAKIDGCLRVRTPLFFSSYKFVALIH